MLPALLAVLQLHTMHAPPAHSFKEMQSVVLHAVAAVNGDSVAAVRRRWQARAPSSPDAALGLATLARLKYDYPDAERRYRALLSSSDPQTPAQLYALLGRAQTRAQRWQVAAAVRDLEQTASSARRLGDRHAEAEALLVLAYLTGRTSVDTALALVRRAVPLVVGDPVLDAALHCTQASVLRPAHPGRADSIAERGLMLAMASGDQRLLARCFLMRAHTQDAVGRRIQALTYADTALAIAKQANDKHTMAFAAQYTAYLHTQWGVRFDLGRTAAADAIRYGAESGNQLAIAWAELNLAQLAVRLGDGGAANRSLARAGPILSSLRDDRGVAAAFATSGAAAMVLGEPNRARAAYDSALVQYTRRGFEAFRPFLLFNLAILDSDAGRHDRARSLFEQGYSVGRKLDVNAMRTQEPYYVRGLLALRRGEYDAAARDFEAYVVRASDINPHARFDARMRLAETYARAGQLNEAERVLQEGFEDLDRTRAALRDRHARVAVLRSRRVELDPDLGIATVVNLLAREGRVAAAFRAVEAQRARHLWEQRVRRAALSTGPHADRAFGDGATAATAGDLDAVQREIPARTALLAYITGAGGEPTTLFLVHRDAARSWTLAPADSLIGDITRFSTLLEAGMRARPLARKLGGLLLDSALAVLPAHVSRLVVIPDGALQRVPFDALELKDGRAAIERFTISRAPSARLLRALWSAPSRARPGRLVAFGSVGAIPEANLPALPGARRELRAVARFARGAEVRSGARASEAALKARDWSGTSILHLATHARVEDTGIMSSAIFLRSGSGEDGRLGVEEIAELSLAVDLVVLSSCRTAGGVVVSGEGLQGLTAPFMEAGARAIVATHWPVGDRSIVPVMVGFYAGLARGMPAGEALREARLAALRAGASPAVWAALAIAGDASVRPRLR